MIAMCLVWFSAGIAAWGYGNLCFAGGVRGRAWTLTPDAVGVRIYFGLLVLAVAPYLAALLTNVSWWVGLLAVIPGFLLGVRDLMQSRPNAGRRESNFLPWPIAVGTVTILALFLSTREVNFFDTGLYHQQAVKWLSEYGLVRGIALLHFRLGWTSSWFAWAAVLNHGVLEGREAPVIGGMPFALIITTTLAALWRIWKTKALLGLTCLTLGFFYALLTVVTVAWNIESSLSADLVIWILPFNIAIIVSDAALNGPDRVGLALALAALTCDVKLTAAPMLAYSGVLWIWSFARVPANRKRLMGYLGVATLAMVIVVMANTKTSGCPLFPSSIACISGESSVGRTTATALTLLIHQFAKQGNRHVLIFLVLALAASVVSYRLRQKDPFLLHCLAASWCGMIFVVATAPNPRFGLGYFFLPAAVCAAAILKQANSWKPAYVRRAVTCAPIFVASLAVSCIVVSTRQNSVVSAVAVPARMPSSVGDQVHTVNRSMNVRTQLRLSERRAGTVVVWEPQSSAGQCWDAPLPCTPKQTVEILDLKDPIRGFAGGFRSGNLVHPSSVKDSSVSFPFR